MDDALLGRVQDYLDRHNVMTLATHGPAGPWAAAVFYARDGLRLYFVSSPGSRHGRDLEASRRAAAAIHEDDRGWTEIQGVQLEGRVAPVDDADLPRVRAIYSAKFPFLGKGGELPAAIVAALDGPADLVLSDMAAPATGHSRTDHLRIMALAEAAYLSAAEVLAPGGAFVAKVLQGGAEQSLLAQLKRDFAQVRHAKPPASRSDSAEMYVVAMGFRKT